MRIMRLLLRAILTIVLTRSVLSQPPSQAANVAASLFKYNYGRVESTWKQLNNPSKSWLSTQQTTTLLQAAASSKHVQCFLGVEIKPTVPLQAHMEGLHSNNASQCTAFKPRIEAFLMALNHFVLPNIPADFVLQRPVRFWYDLTPSTVIPSETYSMLQLPILTSGAAAYDTGSLLIPEIYRFMGMLAGEQELLDRYVSLYPHTREFVLGLYSVFEGTHAAHTKPWSQKLDKAVFRGTCMSTFNPDPTPGATPLMLRGALCQVATSGSQGRIPLDVGMTMKTNNDPPLTQRCATAGDLADGNGQACKMCKECLQEKRMSRQELAMHKYQIAIDGLGATFDALFHKLTSNSVVFVIHTVLQAGQPAVPAHRLWYQPLLQPKVNYINTTVDQLQKDIDWCADHQHECQQIAKAAMSEMQPLMGNTAVVAYMKHVLEALAIWDGQVLKPTQPSASNPTTNPTMLHLPAWQNVSVIPRNDTNLLQQLPGVNMPSATSREKDTDDVVQTVGTSTAQVGTGVRYDKVGSNNSSMLIPSGLTTNRTLSTTLLDAVPTATGAVQKAMSEAVAQVMQQSTHFKTQTVQPVAVHHDDGSFVVRSFLDTESTSVYKAGPL